MTTQIEKLADSADAKDPLPLPVRHSQFWMWITPALSVVILGVVIWHLRSLDFQQILAAVPTSPWFWLVFFSYYLVGIVFDFITFRWLWGIPLEGLVALARKNVSNELIVDYLGEAYFYSWARRKVTMEGSPFGAIKDVAILSAVVSNIFTLVMLAIVYPYAKSFNLGFTGSALAASIGLISLISLLVALFSRRIFSLTRKQLVGISGLHFLRLIAAYGLLALAWSMALPNVALGWWLVLATVKLLLSRLPLISNKDVIFAGVAVLAVGRDTEIQILMAVMATLILLTHLIIGVALAIGDLVTIPPKSRPAQR